MRPRWDDRGPAGARWWRRSRETAASAPARSPRSHKQQPELVLAGRGLAMLVAEDLLADGERLARRRFRFGDPRPRSFSTRASSTSVTATSLCSLPSSRRRIARLSRSSGSAAARLPSSRCSTPRSLRLCATRTFCGPSVRRPIASACSSSGSALLVHAHALVGAADHGEHLGLQLRLIAQARSAMRAAAASSRLRTVGSLGVRRAIRIGARQHAGQQLADLRRLLRLQPRAIALRGQLHRVEADQRGQHRARRRRRAVTPRQWRRTNLAAR